MLHPFVNTITNESQNVQAICNRPRIFLPYQPSHCVLDGWVQLLSPGHGYYVPAGSLVFMPESTDMMCLTLVDKSKHHSLAILDDCYRYRQNKQLQGTGPLSSFMNGHELHNDEISPAIIDALVIWMGTVIADASLAGGAMTVIQRLQFVADLEDAMENLTSHSANALASYLSLTETTLWRKCIATTRLNTRDFMATWRYRRAFTQLITTNCTVEDIASRNGYATGTYLLKLVKKNAHYSVKQLRLFGYLQ